MCLDVTTVESDIVLCSPHAGSPLYSCGNRDMWHRAAHWHYATAKTMCTHNATVNVSAHQVCKACVFLLSRVRTDIFNNNSKSKNQRGYARTRCNVHRFQHSKVKSRRSNVTVNKSQS